MPALLSVLAFGSLFIIVTSGGSDEPPIRPHEERARSAADGGKGQRRMVTVRSGDTAAAIAERAGLTVDRLRTLNPGVALDTLRPGQRLRLAR